VKKESKKNGRPPPGTTTSKKIRSGAGGSLKKGSAVQRHGWRKKRAEETRKTNGESKKEGPAAGMKAHGTFVRRTAAAPRRGKAIGRKKNNDVDKERRPQGAAPSRKLHGTAAAPRHEKAIGRGKNNDADKERRPRGAAPSRHAEEEDGQIPATEMESDGAKKKKAMSTGEEAARCIALIYKNRKNSTS
jgi:hypothetical protein